MTNSITWKRESGREIVTNDDDRTVRYCLSLGFKPVKGLKNAKDRKSKGNSKDNSRGKADEQGREYVERQGEDGEVEDEITEEMVSVASKSQLVQIIDEYGLDRQLKSLSVKEMRSSVLSELFEE